MHVEVKVPGSCGELIQGTLAGEPFLVTCPIDCYTTVTVRKDKKPSSENHHHGLRPKASRALTEVLHFFDEGHYPYHLQLESELPIGKGMASSSADIAAVCIAVATSLQKKITAEQIGRIASEIEPTDGVFFEGVVQMNPLLGVCQKHLGQAPSLQIAIFDTGGVIDTLKFHTRQDLASLNYENEALIREALTVLNASDAVSIGRAAVISALANQSILYKKYLPQIIDVANETGALGVNVAHSGTVLGILFAPEASTAFIEHAISRIQQRFLHLQYMKTVHLISGGCIISETAGDKSAAKIHTWR